MDAGGYLVRVVLVSPGNGGRKPFVSAVRSVERAGEKSAAWEKATSSLGVADVGAVAQHVGSQTVVVEAAGVAGVETSCRCHRPVAGVRVPVRMQEPVESVTVTDVASKMTRQPASQSWPMEIRDAVVRSGTMCT